MPETLLNWTATRVVVVYTQQQLMVGIVSSDCVARFLTTQGPTPGFVARVIIRTIRRCARRFTLVIA